MLIRTGENVLIAKVTNQDAQYLLTSIGGHWRPSTRDPKVSVFEFDQDMVWGKRNWRGEEVFTLYIWRALEVAGCGYVEVRFLPFTHRLIDPSINPGDYEDASLIPEARIDDSGLVMVCGATLLSVVAQERGWRPGSFANENISFPRWLEQWGDNMLNSVATVGPLGTLDSPYPGRVFIRPIWDTKVFTGMTIGSEQIPSWRTELLAQGRDPRWLSPETEVAISPLAEINAEYRLFCVDGRIVTGSMYRLGRRIVYDPYIPPYCLDFAEQMIRQWQPARAFVLDVAETPDGPKIIEINNINCSGFYACDVFKIVDAVERMEF